MNKLKVRLTIVGLVLACAAFAGDQSAELKAYLTKRMPEMDKAFATKDVKFFESSSTPDFTYTDITGQTAKKKASIDSLKMMFSTASNIKCKSTILSVKAANDKGTVKASQDFSCDMKLGDQKTHKMTMKSTYTETWKKVKGMWLVSSIKEDKATMTLDGKPFDPTKGMPGG